MVAVSALPCSYSKAWTPNDLVATLTCWYLPENTTTVDVGLPDGVSVAAWDNEVTSVAGSLAQVTSSRRPTLLTLTQNGHGVIKFDGTDIVSDGDIDELDVGTGDIWYAIVFKSTDTSAEQNVFEKDHLRFGLVIQSDGDLQFRFGGPGSSNNAQQNNGNWSRSNFVVASARRSSGVISAFVDGGSVDVTEVSNTESIDNSSALEVGGRAAAAAGKLTGEICEILIGGGTITDRELLAIDGYLAHKYALDGNLISTHKYKKGQPWGLGKT